MAEAKEGELFTRSYQRSPTKLSDSIKARRRVAARFLASMSVDQLNKFPLIVKGELGAEYPYFNGWFHNGFWEKSDVSDFLSAITLWIRQAPNQLTVARDILEQEDLHYKMDDRGGIHFLVDAEFSSAVEAALSGLDRPEFTAARAALQEGLKALSPVKQSGKGLIRGVFEAVESSFLVVIGPNTANRLNKQSVDGCLKLILLDRYKEFPEAEDKVARVLETLNAWVREAHPYRHGAPFEQVHEAPIELALLSATSGMGFIRLFAGLR
ncbi:hypothetical protein [Agrobacterium bohemicum]|uniref:Uncharacterized protein n=1 Tax=Agrobacterium bohemicum TaxID=2052828 RepID=A0A135NYU4_9HYPH|nr:hypothetical protein [Agrobacterium bohemicum]KXG84338.1 hypothetical protein ATO67_12520 [Agrobacterium bohemicum]